MDSKTRFSSRVDNYIKYRPHYPPTIFEELEVTLGMTSAHIVADVGSGTGISSEIFLSHGNTVFGIEPNLEMRQAAERLLERFENFYSVDGSAEVTTMEDRSIDYVVAGQAFHWFDRKLAREEFKRILRPDGWVVLLWNDRQTKSTPFLRDYEELIRTFGTDYAEVNHQNIDQQQIEQFFGSKDVIRLSFPNHQTFDYDGVRGRLLSSSYIADERDPRFAPMLRRLEEIVNEYQVDGHVEILYDTLVFAGKL